MNKKKFYKFAAKPEIREYFNALGMNFDQAYDFYKDIVTKKINSNYNSGKTRLIVGRVLGTAFSPLAIPTIAVARKSEGMDDKVSIKNAFFMCMNVHKQDTLDDITKYARIYKDQGRLIGFQYGL